MRAVSIGGGTGQPNSIRALRSLGLDTTAIVAMADDGGSSGILRERIGIIPPGDIRKCLVAMATDPEDPIVQAFSYRFPYIEDHALGNLLLTALADVTDSFEDAISVCGHLVAAEGYVFPSTLENVTLGGMTCDGRIVDGQARIGEGPTALERVWLIPHHPEAYEPAVRAIREADVIVLGPGSLFTSIIPNLLVPGIRDAIHESSATTIFVCSLADMQGETWGLSAVEHLRALLDHGMQDRLDVMLVHKPKDDDQAGIATRSFTALTGEQIEADARARALGHTIKQIDKQFIRPIVIDETIIKILGDMGPYIIARDFIVPDKPTWHDVDKLAETIGGVIG